MSPDRGKCPACGHDYALRKDRTVRAHLAAPERTASGLHRLPCEGSQRPPAREAVPPPGLDDGMIVYLAGLTAADIRKKMKSVTGFARRPGQDPAEAAQVLARFEANISWRRGVLAILAGLTENPAL